MIGHLPSALSAIVGDLFSTVGWQAGGIAGSGVGAVVQQLLRRRAEAARDILLDEIRRGDKDLAAPDVDAVVASLLRYGRAAQEGAARLNLRLMAQVIAGQAHLGCLYADEFLRRAELLSSLRREEVIYLGELCRNWTATKIYDELEEERMRQVGKLIILQLVPQTFYDEEEISITAAALVRTGLLSSVLLASGGIIYKPTRALLNICKEVNFEAALRAEPA